MEAMKAYVTVADLKSNGEFEGLINIDNKLPEQTITSLLAAGKEMIDSYCNYSFEKEVPHIVKVVNIQLINAFITDMSKKQESIDDYSYTNNQAAFNNILSQLDSLIVNGEALNAKKRSIRARLI